MALVCLLFVALLLGLKHPVFGARPSAQDIQRFDRSPHYNSAERVFENRRAQLFNQMRRDSSTLDLLQEWFTPRVDGSPSQALPQLTPDLNRFTAASNIAKIIWLGHSTFLMNLDGVTVLVDPVFSNAAAPVSFTAKRFQPPVLSLNELPPIDIILISHDHYDHLDMKTIRFFSESHVEFITPLGVGAHLRRWGVDTSRIHENDWWESTRFNDIEFIATPAQHFSGRNGINNNESLWASWVILSGDLRVFFSGDSGYDTHFKKIGERYGPFDVAFMENGQYDSAWEAVHLLPQQTAQAYFDLNARWLFPVHWGMFELAFHTWYDPVVDLAELADARAIALLTPQLGELVELHEDTATVRWWEPLVK